MFLQKIKMVDRLCLKWLIQPAEIFRTKYIEIFNTKEVIIW